MVDWRSVAAVALGGALGTVLRFAVGAAAVARFGTAFPVGTFGINVAGSFAIGIVAELAATRGLPAEARAFLAVGVLGGFTTFSTFSLETLALIRAGSGAVAAAYAAGSVLLGLAAAYAGSVLVRAGGTP